MKRYYWWAFFPISIVYCELWMRLFSGNRFFTWGIITVILFSLFFGLVSQFISCNKNVGLIVVQSVLSLWYSVQTVYHNIFGTYMILYSLRGAEQIAESEMLGEAFLAILKSLWQVLILFIPLVLIIIYVKKIKDRRMPDKKELLIVSGVTVAVLIFTLVLRYTVPYYRDKNAIFQMDRSVSQNGLLYTEILDFGYNILGIENGYELENNIENEINLGGESTKYQPNVMNIDFETLANQETDETVKSLHEYFGSRTPTNKNKYTGMFEGYNLIQVTAEGFSYLAIDKDLTPTLYKMQNEGFNFTNFYTPIWGVSTSDGEYVATTGLIPKGGIWSYYTSGKNNVFFPFSMPQQFLNSGVSPVRAYHNHTYTYYSRQISHKNMGFIYKGIGNGLEKVVNSRLWPESDLEMIKGTTKEYITKDERFMTYYMTVSGHLNYTFIGNSMAARHKNKVKHLPISSNAQAYLACNIELDLAMENLLAALEKAGVAEKTVIVITPDHYPYGLEDKEHIDQLHYFSELAGHEIEPQFELYKSCLIIYSKGMEKAITVDKYCSSVDIIPTLNNLFGFEYDSRLLPGSDILSTADPLVVFNDHSFITKKGKYNADTEEFTLFDGQTVDDVDKYVKAMRKIVNNRFKISAQILETNYYKRVISRAHITP